MMHIKPLLVVLSLVALISISAPAQSDFKNWPAGTSPKEVGKRLAENFVARKLESDQGKRPFVIYPEVCTWYGSLNIARSTKDADLTRRLTEKFAPLLTADGARRINPGLHVDNDVFGTVPLELYRQTRQQQYLTLGQSLADRQWSKTTADGITSEARYWIDDMYMITILQVQAFRATGDKKYLDRAALTMAAYLDKLQQPNGLFFHAPDSQFYWGRGNGWVAAGMAELLRALPKNHPQRERVLKGYRLMMASLLKYQAENGMWRQLLDHPESWEESSCTGMFTFAMVSGVKHGWLDKKSYGPAARKGWLALVAHLDKDANITDVCIGTNKGFTVQYYMDRERRTGDLHGQAASSWSAMALLE
jgi:rhamnogalacturonyl hydrolase YesR